MLGIVDISEVLLLAGLSATCTDTERAIVGECLRSAEAAVRRYLRYDPTKVERTEYYPQTDLHREGRVAIWDVNDTTAFVEELSNFASTELQLTHLPVRSITSIHVDYDGRNGTRSGAFGSGTLRTEGVDFWPNYDGKDSTGAKICRDGIIRSRGSWPDVAGCVQVIYTAGYSAAELHGQDSVVDACEIGNAVKGETSRRIMTVYSRMKKGRLGFLGALSSESLGDYSWSSAGDILSRLVGGDNDLLPETQLRLQEFLRLDMGVL